MSQSSYFGMDVLFHRRQTSSRQQGSSSSSSTIVPRIYHGTPELEKERARKDLMAKPKYRNTLPDIPFDPKHILLPVDTSQYELGPKELSVLYDQHCGLDCGVSLDLVGGTITWSDCGEGPPVELAPEDLFLLEDEPAKKKVGQDTRAITHNKNVTWLRRPEYVSAEVPRFKSRTGEKLEYWIEKVINSKIKVEDFGKLDKLSRIICIEKTFEDAKSPIKKHPSKPNVFAEEVIPVFAD